MGRAKPIQLAGTTYPTKKAAAERVQQILRGPTRDLSGEEHAIVGDLLMRHPEAALKVGPGVARLFVAPAPEDAPGGWNCFYVERLDGSITDFSYQRCLTPPTHRQDVLAAMRCEVAGQVSVAKARRVGEHMDHRVPFVELAEGFVKANALQWDEIVVSPTTDNTWTSRLVDRQLAGRWQDYHERCAGLRPKTRPDDFRSS